MVTNVDELENHHFDALITTNPITYKTNVPMIVVDPFLSDKNIDSIRNKIRSLQVQKKKNKSFKKITTFINKDLCFFNKGYKTSQDAIEDICDFLLSKGLINNTFKEEIYNHEKIASSSYNNIAITHTLSNTDIASFVALSINAEPVSWGENKVNLIFIISLKKDERRNFRELFNSLTEILTENDIFEKMIHAKSYEELENLFTLNF